MADRSINGRSRESAGGYSLRKRPEEHISGESIESRSQEGVSQDVDGGGGGDKDGLGNSKEGDMDFQPNEAVGRTCTVILSRHWVHRPLRMQAAPV
tara:strand:+ start:227 stop:514 length:288 start_codon:yes stop_codon:yes gene_type:complete